MEQRFKPVVSVEILPQYHLIHLKTRMGLNSAPRGKKQAG